MDIKGKTYKSYERISTKNHSTCYLMIIETSKIITNEFGYQWVLYIPDHEPN